jgi:hypothetical protein
MESAVVPPLERALQHAWSMEEVVDSPSGAKRNSDDEPTGRRGGFGSLGSIVYLLSLGWAAMIASYPLNDNSFFTHLATGRMILDVGNVPTSDPYTFTARGEPWTVQSWLASVAYASFERIGGDVGLRLLILSVFLVAVTLLWRLTAPATSIIIRFLLMALALFVVSDLWSERPYMIGVIGLAVVWLVLEGQVRPWVLVPILWVWTNAHGSFPLAVVLCVAVIVGGTLDRLQVGDPLAVPAREKRAFGAVMLGTLLGAVGPLGAKALVFPLTAMTKSGVFSEIVEWRSPSYQSTAERAFLGLVVVTILLLTQRRQWRLTLPAVGFASMALYAQRNIVMATVVLVAVAALCAPTAGTLRSTDRPSLGRPLAAIVGGLVVAISALCLATPVDGFGGYPVRGLAFLEAVHLDGRLATEMPAGNLLGLLDGPTGEVFIDDRVDMYPETVFRDYLVLRRASPGWQDVLDRHQIAVVAWHREEPLAGLLASSDDWTVAFSDSQWMIACRRSDCST